MKRYQRGNIGETNVSNEGCEMQIIDGGGKNNYCTIRIYGGKEIYEKEVMYYNFKKGNIKNLYFPSLCGKGYIGIGDFDIREDGEYTLAYRTWRSMINRCYLKNHNKFYKSYKNAKVCDEWLNFQKFAKWFYDNYKEYEGCRTEIDKDIIGKNKIYSPEYCLLIPKKLNTFMANDHINNKTGYIGVDYRKDRNKYRARTHDFKTGKRIEKNGFYTAKEASEAYVKMRKKQVEIVKEICINEWNITDEKILNNIK